MLYASVKNYLSASIGLENEFFETQFFKNMVNSRMNFHGLVNMKDYLHILKTSPVELDELIENAVVHETWFFRDNEPFVYLRDFLKNNWISRFPERKIRVLSVPCSSGEEPYSIAITLLDAGLKPSQIHIDAVDISQKDIDKAHRGIYSKSSFRGIGSRNFEEYFTVSENGYILSPEVLGLVKFKHDNFIDPGFFWDRGAYDIVFCRNLVIYLTETARQTVLKHLDRLIVPGGLLFAGHAELLFFRKNGYDIVNHPRSFACIKPLDVPIKEHVHKPAKRKVTAHKIIIAKTETQSLTKPQHTEDKAIREPLDTKPMESIIAEARKYADLGALRKALALCEKFIDGEYVDAEGYYLTGLIYNAMNDIDHAEDYFQKTLYLDPYHYDAAVHLSLIYEQKGDAKRTAIMKNRVLRILSRESEMSVQNYEK